MTCYLQITPEGLTRCFWDITAREATRLGVPNPKAGVGTYFRAIGRQTIWEAMKAGAGGWFEPPADRFFSTHLDPGEYYPRIARPSGECPSDPSGVSPFAWSDRATVAMTRGQIETLLVRLRDICLTVHPEASNLGAYGHEIRNLLVLAATEVESQWKGVLVANGVSPPRATTADYVTLAKPMRLAEYGISFTSYPWLPEIRPFLGWTPRSPTSSLPWYHAYNTTKHDREGHFDSATLEHCLAAVAACVTMAVAQFTADQSLGTGELRSAIALTRLPTWDPSQCYVEPGLSGSDVWIARAFPFSNPPPIRGPAKT